MAKIIFGMNMSLDGYVDHDAFGPDGPDAVLFRYFIEQARGLTGSIYGRRLYEIMSYWDEDHEDWSPDYQEFARVWRRVPKWVVSRTLTSVGPNATLVSENMESVVRKLKAELTGDIEVGGADLARSLTALGLIDEYQIYLHPVVLGQGKPYFNGSQPSLRLTDHRRIGEKAIRLTYVPA